MSKIVKNISNFHILQKLLSDLVLGLSDHPLLPPVDRGRQVGGNLALGCRADTSDYDNGVFNVYDEECDDDDDNGGGSDVTC